MRVNSGGDPGRDDYGLPPVDIEVPDDARELDRDVQSYHRELRSERRRVLARRLYGPLTRDGMVLPLLAGCLALTLLAATLLTVFTVGQGVDTGPLASPGVSGSGGPIAGGSGAGVSLSPAAGTKGGQLPDAMVELDGQPTHLIDITGPGHYVVVLALIPPGCNCVRDLRQLTSQAELGGAQTFLIGTRGEDVSQLSTMMGLGRAHAVQASLGVLPAFYRDPTMLTAVLVGKDGLVADEVLDKHGFQITAELRSLMTKHAEQSPSPGTSLATATPAG
jgi:hypothetical protein